MFHYLRNYKLLVAALFLLLPMQHGGIAGEITPEEVKATYILKMRPFFKTGSDAHSIAKLCYYEKVGVPYEESVGQIISQYFTQHPDPAISIKGYHGIQDFVDCDMLYIPASESSNVDNILAALGSKSVLTISSIPQFIFKGGMVGFVLDNANHVKMEANLHKMKSTGIQANPQILEIMEQVVN